MVPGLIELVIILILVGNVFLLGSGRIFLHIRIIGYQGILLGTLPILISGGGLFWRDFFIVAMSVGIKGIVLPLLLNKTARSVKVTREADPFVGYPASLVTGVIIVLMAFWLGKKLTTLSGDSSSAAFLIPIALTTILVGLFHIITRKKAISQAIGYLVFENGIWALGVALVRETSVMLELAILLDIFVAVFVLGIAIYEIKNEFHHVDMDRLNLLKG